MKKKYIIRFIIFIVIVFSLVLAILNSSEKTQYMNTLDYKIELSENSEMTITETWDMYINRTNTIFRDIELSKKYGSVEDVNVVDLDTGKSLNQINTEEYHVPTDSFYALEISKNKFEIAWGTGLENNFGRKRYQITYKISNIINSYTDCQEWYWQLLGEGENAVPVNKVTGTVILPKDIENIDNLRVWGHGPANGNIEKTSNKEIKFEIDKLTPDAMLELRVVTGEQIFNVQNENNLYNYRNLDRIIQEETDWSNETNEKAQSTKIFFGIIGLIYLVFIIRYIIKTIRYIKINKKENDGIRKSQIKYYRDIPRENESTPNEASYLYNYNKKSLSNSSVQYNMVSATILDLCLKKIISLREENEKIYIKILDNKPQELNADEMEIFKVLKAVGKNKEKFEIGELNKYAKKEYYKYSTCINNTVNFARNNLYRLKLINKREEKEYASSDNAEFKLKMLLGIYIILIIIAICMHIPIFKVAAAANFGISFQSNFILYMLGLLPLIILMTISLKLQAKIKDKIAVLTQEGADEKAKWKGLASYMKEFSRLDEKEVPELVIWEKYLVYATAFGIADKAIEQMKAKYPKVFVQEKWDDEKMTNEYPIIHFVSNPVYVTYNNFNPITNISSNVKTAYKTSMTEIAAHSSSSGSGGGGGFSGGGGRRRRTEAGMGGR